MHCPGWFTPQFSVRCQEQSTGKIVGVQQEAKKCKQEERKCGKLCRTLFIRKRINIIIWKVKRINDNRRKE